MIKITLEHAGRRTHSEGKTMDEALQALKSPGVIKVKSVLSATDGSDTINKVLLPSVVNRMFHPSPSIGEMSRRKVSQMFDFNNK